jgi:cytochrome P450
MATATSEPVRLPPTVRLPKIVQGVALVAAMCEVIAAAGRRYGSTYTFNLPIWGPTVVVSDPALVKELFSTGSELVERPTDLGEVFGPGSTFSLTGEPQLARRKLILPPFHGKRVMGYQQIIEEETLREIDSWPEGEEFEILEPMNRITLNTILRTVFGAEGPALDELRALVPPAITIGSRLHFLPKAAARDFGAWSPGRRLRDIRRRIDDVIGSLIADARADTTTGGRRTDVLTKLLDARYDDGVPIDDQDIADELLTLVSAGHETTGAELAWAIERLRRHPGFLTRLADEVDRGGSELRQATIHEVLRTRPALDATMRLTKKRIRLQDWVIPENTRIIVSIQLAHALDDSFIDASDFNPDRFLGDVPKPYAWIPFGGGSHRCIGAALATAEMDVVLRVLLRELTFEPTSARGERRLNRGVAIVPRRGGRTVAYRRRPRTGPDAGSAALDGNTHGLLEKH